jgi:hypothetical protein
MRKEIIAIGIIAMIAVCATLAMAEVPTTKININYDDAKVVFFNDVGVYKIEITSVDVLDDFTDTILVDVKPVDEGFAYFVEFGTCNPDKCNELCYEDLEDSEDSGDTKEPLDAMEYDVKVFDINNELVKSGTINIPNPPE